VALRCDALVNFAADRNFQISGKGIGDRHGYASSRMTAKVMATRSLGSIRVLTTTLTEVRMHIGSVLLIVWLVVGVIAGLFCRSRDGVFALMPGVSF
jgi:hypothetical protein